MNNIDNHNVPKMVTIREAAKTGILPENAIRTMVKNGTIQAVYSGNTAYINFQNLCIFLNTLTVNQQGGSQ